MSARLLPLWRRTAGKTAPLLPPLVAPALDTFGVVGSRQRRVGALQALALAAAVTPRPRPWKESSRQRTRTRTRTRESFHYFFLLFFLSLSNTGEALFSVCSDSLRGRLGCWGGGGERARSLLLWCVDCQLGQPGHSRTRRFPCSRLVQSRCWTRNSIASCKRCVAKFGVAFPWGRKGRATGGRQGRATGGRQARAPRVGRGRDYRGTKEGEALWGKLRHVNERRRVFDAMQRSGMQWDAM